MSVKWNATNFNPLQTYRIKVTVSSAKLPKPINIREAIDSFIKKEIPQELPKSGKKFMKTNKDGWRHNCNWMHCTCYCSKRCRKMLWRGTTNYILLITFTEISTEEPKRGISNFLTTMMTPNQGMFFIYKSWPLEWRAIIPTQHSSFCIFSFFSST